MADTRLGWKKALEVARKIVDDGALTRPEHLEVFKTYQDSTHQQDQRIAIALLSIYIEKYTPDFDRDVTLDKLIEHGNKISAIYFKDFGRKVLYPVLKARSVPAVWIDRIADEEPVKLRHAFIYAVGELAARKRNPLERILGILRYFLDEPSAEVRETIAITLKRLAQRDPERLHYFMVEHEKGAGSHRKALFNSVRGLLGWKDVRQ